MNKKIKCLIIGATVSIGFFFLSGVVTGLLPNSLFARMTPNTPLDKIFLVSSSFLIGAYVGVHYYIKNTIKKCDTIATAGGIGSFLAFACPVCNKLLVLLFGATVLMTYLNPYRPALGFISNGLLLGAIYWRLRS